MVFFLVVEILAFCVSGKSTRQSQRRPGAEASGRGDSRYWFMKLCPKSLQVETGRVPFGQRGGQRARCVGGDAWPFGVAVISGFGQTRSVPDANGPFRALCWDLAAFGADPTTHGFAAECEPQPKGDSVFGSRQVHHRRPVLLACLGQQRSVAEHSVRVPQARLVHKTQFFQHRR